MPSLAHIVIVLVIGVLISLHFIRSESFSLSSRNFLEAMVAGTITIALGVWTISLIFYLIKFRKTKERDPYLFLSIGMFCLMLGILVNRLGSENLLGTIGSIPLFGISIVFNLIYLNKYRHQRSAELESSGSE